MSVTGRDSVGVDIHNAGLPTLDERGLMPLDDARANLAPVCSIRPEDE